MGSKKSQMECVRPAWSNTKLQKAGSGPPSSSLMVSVVGQVVEVSDIFTYLELDVTWTPALTGVLVSHPSHWDSMTECGVIIIYPNATIRVYTMLAFLYS